MATMRARACGLRTTGCVQQAGRRDVVHEAAASAQQARIFVTGDARADRPRGHVD